MRGKTVLFVGAGRHQRRAIVRAKELGLRVVAVDRNPDAPGLDDADVGEVVDFADVEGVIEAGRRHGVDGVLTVSADRAVPVVAAVAEALGLPGIGAERRARDDAQDRDAAAARRGRRAAAALRGGPRPRARRARRRRGRLPGGAEAGRLGRPARRLPRSSRSTTSRRTCTRRSPSPRTARRSSRSSTRALELNGLVIARDGEAATLTLSDRLRPPGIGFGVGWIHVYPATIYGDHARGGGARRRPRDARARAPRRDRLPAAARHGRGRRSSIEVRGADPRRPDGRPRAARRRRRPRRGRAAAWRSARSVPDELALPRFQQPLAIRFLTASPGPLPTGRVDAASARSSPCSPPPASSRPTRTSRSGETIRPVRLDGDRRGYVIAVADTNLEALERAEAAARLSR